MSNELAYWLALKRIGAYLGPDKLKLKSCNLYGLEYVESVEYAYENVLNEARAAVRGKRRPKV